MGWLGLRFSRRWLVLKERTRGMLLLWLRETPLWCLKHSALITGTKEVCKFTSEAESDRIISGLRWIGLLSDEKATITGGNLLDTLCAQLEKLMSFQPGEQDLVMLQHKFVVEWADGKTVSCFSTVILLYNLLILCNRMSSLLPSNCWAIQMDILVCYCLSALLAALRLSCYWTAIQHWTFLGFSRRIL